MARPWNFSAGPAVFPRPVLERMADELTDWNGTGTSVLEMSHRGKAFVSIAAGAEARLRDLLAVPDDHAVLFLQGGASLQFATLPSNLLPVGGRAAYVDSGAWATKAIAEARRTVEVDVIWSGKDQAYATLPVPGDLDAGDAGYLHVTSNETIGGVQFRDFPEHPLLVADMSSDILSRAIDVSRFGVLYAGAQKNIGPAGLTVVVVRRDLLGRSRPELPGVLDFAQQAENDSMLNTPPTYAIYAAGLVFEWIAEQGGVAAIEAANAEKAALLYDAIDSSGFYRSPVDPRVRSLMNVPFRLTQEELESVFLAEAGTAGLLELKGHRSVGGIRASIYNAMPRAGVEALVSFMGEFERRHG